MKYLPVLLTLLVFSLCAAEKRVLYLAGESNAAVAKRAFRDMKLPEPIRFLVIPDASDRRLLETEIAGADLIIANGLVPEFRDALARLGTSRQNENPSAGNGASPSEDSAETAGAYRFPDGERCGGIPQ